jgi:imidazolonepropionase-like amidohydrolase
MNKTLRLLAVCLGMSSVYAQAPSTFAIRNARVVTIGGPTLEHGTVVLRNGLIEAVGENVAAPADAWVIEGQGLTVYPGLIDGLSTWGMPETPPATQPAATPAVPSLPAPAPGPPGRRSALVTTAAPVSRGPEDRPSNTSWLRAADMIGPTDRRIEDARSAGFTSAVTFPTSGIFAGQGAIINLAGEKAGQMVVASPAGLYLSLATRSFGSFPGSMMGAIAYVRQIFLDAEHYRLEKDFYARHPGTKRPAYDRAIEGMLDAPRVLLPAQRAIEVDRMVRFAAELKTGAVLYGGHEAYRAADVLRKSSMPLLVSLKWPERSRDANPDEIESLRTLELRDRAPSTPAALAKAGVRFAFYSDGTPNPRDLHKAVKRAIDAGLAPADAVRALTLSAAEIYGIADRLGSIEKGKIANLVVTDGQLFQDNTKIKYIFIDGAKYEPTPPRTDFGPGARPSGIQTPTEREPEPPYDGGLR